MRGLCTVMILNGSCVRQCLNKYLNTTMNPFDALQGNLENAYIYSGADQKGLKWSCYYSQPRWIRTPLISHFRLVRHYLLDTVHWQAMLNSPLKVTPPNSLQNKLRIIQSNSADLTILLGTFQNALQNHAFQWNELA